MLVVAALASEHNAKVFVVISKYPISTPVALIFKDKRVSKAAAIIAETFCLISFFEHCLLARLSLSLAAGFQQKRRQMYVSTQGITIRLFSITFEDQKNKAVRQAEKL